MVIENPLMPPRLGVGTIPNTQPFTMRENFSQMGLVEGMRKWINFELIPFINTNIENLSNTWVEQANQLITDFELIVVGLVEQVNGAVAEIGDQVDQATAAQVAAEAARDLAAQYASQMIAMQDQTVADITNDGESATRESLDALYASVGALSNVTDVLAGRLSAVTLAETFANKGTQEAVETGRLSVESLAETFAPRIPTVINLGDVVPPSAADVTAEIQAVLTDMGAGDTLIWNAGTWRVDGTLTCAAAEASIRMEAGSVIDRSNGNQKTSVIHMSGARASLVGPGEIRSAAAWDGVNNEWTYATVFMTGADPTVEDIKLTNVHRVGIGFKNNDGIARVSNVTIMGNYPVASWTGVETVHFGIGYDPGAVNARLIARGNNIRGCVQGICPGNYGIGSSLGSIVSGNTFEGCHNHAIYSTTGVTYVTFTGNTIIDCAQPIVMSGAGNVVTGNTLISTGSTTNLHTVCNIQMRDSIGGIVANNRMRGALFNTSPAIDFFNLNGVETRDNVCEGNSIEIIGAADGVAVRMGNGTTTSASGNMVRGNTIRGGGITNLGIVTVQCAAGTPGSSTIVEGNTITMTRASAGVAFVFIVGNNDVMVRGNIFRLEADSVAAIVIGGVRTGATAKRVDVSENSFICEASYGANITMRCIYEDGGTTDHRYFNNRYRLDPTKVVPVNHFIQPASASTINEEHDAAPGVVAGPGSIWRRRNGGAGTSIYIKETLSTSNVWRAL